MLKIKDNVDLKELEKFGFKRYGNHYQKVFIDNPRTSVYIDFWIYDGLINLRLDTETQIIDLKNELDFLYDLIQAGLVEKVEDEN